MRIRLSSYSLQDYPSVLRRVVNAIGSIHRVGLHHWHRLWEIGRMIVFRPFRRFGISLTLCLLVLAHPSRASDESGYATAVRAEYVFACMTMNGGTQDALQRCSCPIVVFAWGLPNKSKKRGKPALRRGRPAGGSRGGVFRSKPTN